MADTKISNLTSAEALVGTEVAPIVQSGTTKKATIDQILAPANGKGINYSAAGGNTLTIYKEGTWVPSLGVNGFSGAPSTTSTSGTYTRIGRIVVAHMTLTLASSSYPATYCVITGLPFQPSSTGNGVGSYTGFNPGSGVQGGTVQTNTSSQITWWPSSATTTSTVWSATVTYFV
jgi:hypothetical protein